MSTVHFAFLILLNCLLNIVLFVAFTVCCVFICIFFVVLAAVLNRCIGDISLIACTASNDNQDSIASQRDKQTKSFQKDFFDFINSGISSILNSAQSVKGPRGGVCKKDIQGSKMIESKSRDYKVMTV